jgi:hypothetical protein
MKNRANTKPGERVFLAEMQRAQSMKDLNTISHDIIQSAIEVHKELEPGLLESV